MPYRQYKGITPIIGLPLERSLSYAERVLPWIIQLAQQGWAFIDPARRRTDLNRIMYCMHLLDNPRFSHLVMLDIDHLQPVDIVFRLCEAVAEDRSRLVVSGLTHRRREPFEPIAFIKDGDKFEAVTDWEQGEVVKVDMLSPACTIFSREVFENIDPPWWAYTYEPGQMYYPTEDVYFCEVCREHGVEMWVDTRIRSPHISVGAIDDNVFRAHAALRAPTEVRDG